MAKICFDNFEKETGQALDKKQRETLDREHSEIRQNSQELGIDAEAEVDGVKFTDKKVTDETNTEVLELLDDFMAQADSFQKTSSFKRDLQNNIKRLMEEDKKLSLDEATQKAIVSMIFDTNDTRGAVPFLELVKSMKNDLLQDFNNITLRISGKTFDDYIANKKNYQAFYKELFEIETNQSRVDSSTGNVEAFKIAKEFHTLKMGIVANRILTGDKTSFANAKSRIIWDKGLVGKKTRQQFIDEHIDDLDEGVHGTRIEREKVLDDLYSHLTEGNANWRTAGDTAQKGRSTKFLRRKAPILQWKDGDTFLRLHGQYSRVGLQQQLMADISEFARESAIKQFLGNNPQQTINFIKRTAGTVRKTSAIRGALDKLDQMLNPHDYEYNNAYAWIRSALNLQIAAKLGTAPITATLDIPTAIIAGKGLFSLDFSQTIKLLINPFKLSLNEEKRWANEMAFVFDDMVGRLSDENSAGATFSGKINRGADYIAQKSMKISFLQQWTNATRGAVQGILSRKLGTFITNKTAFKDLPKPLQQALRKYGIDDVARGGEPAWTRLLRTQPINERGFINIRELEPQVFETAFGNTPLRTKLTTLFNDVGRTLVIEGNDYDRALVTFFSDDRQVGGALLKATTQFKSIAVAVYRKILVRYGKQNSTGKSLLFGSFLIANLTMMGAFINAAKDFVAGREPVKDKGEVFARALITGGGAGIVSDLFMQMGGEELVEAIAGGESQYIRPQDAIFGLLGPVFSDAAKLVTGGFMLATTPFTDDEDFRKRLRPLTRTLADTVPLQNLWWARMVIRKYLHEFLQEMADPRGWNEKERRLNNRARDTRRNGEYNNVLYESLPDLF